MKDLSMELMKVIKTIKKKKAKNYNDNYNNFNYNYKGEPCSNNLIISNTREDLSINYVNNRWQEQGKLKSSNENKIVRKRNSAKVSIVGNSMIKFLKQSDVSADENNVKVTANLGATTEDMFDLIKPIVRRKANILLTHTDTNDLTNNVNTIRKVRNIVEYI